MIGSGNIAAIADAGALIGTVFGEAIVLYVGYGALEQSIGHRMVERIRLE
ncbi:hypothetical protein [Natrinema sp. 1APR25-10V2]|nr:hypothetical protein [Natrinema sp. 1APR25-10V2]MDS0478692.1 hypothetical protein [Natrinema sp. 1APR25-10V2]